MLDAGKQLALQALVLLGSLLGDTRWESCTWLVQDLALLTADAPQSWLQPGVDLTLPGVVPAANAITRRGGLQAC